jgi:hypothetical protein
MTLIYTMDDAQWSRLVQDVANLFDDVTIKRGFQYFKQDRVTQLTLSTPRTIEAVVIGTEPYRVVMNLDHISSSLCECPVNHSCKHMIAVLLDYTDRQERSVPMLVNARARAELKPISKPSPYRLLGMLDNKGAQLKAKKAELEASLKEQAARVPDRSIAQWHAFFELCTSHVPLNTRSIQYVDAALNAIHRVKTKLPPVVEHLYTLHIHLFLLAKITKKLISPTDYAFSYNGFYTDQSASDLQETIEGCFTSGAVFASDPVNHHLINQTLTFLRTEMLTESHKDRYFLDTYHGYWHHWVLPNATDAAPYRDELLQLEHAKLELGPSLSPSHLMLAQIWMNFYCADDQEAWTLLHAVNKLRLFPSDRSMYFFYQLAQKEQWNRLIVWLTELSSLLNNRKDDLRHYLEFWELAVRYLPDTEKQMWDTLADMLPYSRVIYEEKLIKEGQWKRWVDFHLSIGSDPLDFRVTELAPFEKNAPEMLLPFYHQAVERYVLNKNRDSYKVAVRLLKRLAKLYKKIKHEERWELYFNAFTGKYSRLRALQEELRKGKLLQ